MPEQVSPSGDDWGAAPTPGRGVQPPGTGSPAWANPPPVTGGSNAGWDAPARDTPTQQRSGSAAPGWAAGPGQPAGSFAGPAAGQASAPPDVLPSSGSGGRGTVNPPIWILLIGLVLPLLSIPLLFVDGLFAHVVGWVIAIFGSIGALAAFTAADLRLRSSRWYVDQPGLLAGLRIAVLLTGLVVATCFAYLIADAVARWDVWF